MMSDTYDLTNINSDHFPTISPIITQPVAPHVILAVIQKNGAVDWREFSLPLSIRDIESWSGLTGVWFQTIVDFQNYRIDFDKKQRFEVSDSERLYPHELYPEGGYLVCGYVEDEEEKMNNSETSTTIQYINQYLKENRKTFEKKLVESQINLNEFQQPQDSSLSIQTNQPAESLAMKKMKNIFANDPLLPIISSYFCGLKSDETFENALDTIIKNNANPKAQKTAPLLIHLRPDIDFGTSFLDYYPVDAQIFHAIVVGDVRKLWFLFECTTVDPFFCDEHLRTMLHFLGIFGASNLQLLDVMHKKKPEAVKKLINSTDDLGRTPLHYAASFDTTSILVQAFLNLGADPTIQDNSGLIAAHNAFFSDRTQNSFILLHNLSMACEDPTKSSSLDIVKVNQSSTPFHLAIIFDSRKNFEYLIENYEDKPLLKTLLKKKSPKWRTCFEDSISCCDKSDYFFFKFLATFTLEELCFDVKNQVYCETAMKTALSKKNKNVFKKLLELSGGTTEFDLAEVCSYDEGIAAELLSTRLKQPQESASFFNFLLQEACFFGYPSITQELIKSGQVDVNFIPSAEAIQEIEAITGEFPKLSNIHRKFLYLRKFCPPILLALLSPPKKDKAYLVDQVIEIIMHSGPENLDLSRKIGTLGRNILHEFIIRQESKESATLFNFFMKSMDFQFQIETLIDEPDLIGFTPLAYAVLLEKSDFKQILESFGANLTKKNFLGISAALQQRKSVFNVFVQCSEEELAKRRKEKQREQKRRRNIMGFRNNDGYDVETDPEDESEEENDPSPTPFQENHTINARYQIIRTPERILANLKFPPRLEKDSKKEEEIKKILFRIFELKTKLSSISESLRAPDFGVEIEKDQNGDIFVRLEGDDNDNETTFDKFEDLGQPTNQNKSYNRLPSFSYGSIFDKKNKEDEEQNRKNAWKKNFRLPTTLYRILEISHQISSFHSKVGLVHGNICLKALRFEQNFSVQVSGFGFPFDFDPELENLEQNASKPTSKIYNFQHFAPEVRKSGHVNWNFQSDIYSFAKLACSLLLKKEFTSLEDYLQSNVGKTHQTNDSMVYKFINSQIIKDCLEDDPKNRPRSMHDVFMNLWEIILPALEKFPDTDFGFLKLRPTQINGTLSRILTDSYADMDEPYGFASPERELIKDKIMQRIQELKLFAKLNVVSLKDSTKSFRCLPFQKAIDKLMSINLDKLKITEESKKAFELLRSKLPIITSRFQQNSTNPPQNDDNLFLKLNFKKLRQLAKNPENREMNEKIAKTLNSYSKIQNFVNNGNNKSELAFPWDQIIELIFQNLHEDVQLLPEGPLNFSHHLMDLLLSLIDGDPEFRDCLIVFHRKSFDGFISTDWRDDEPSFSSMLRLASYLLRFDAGYGKPLGSFNDYVVFFINSHLQRLYELFFQGLDYCERQDDKRTINIPQAKKNALVLGHNLSLYQYEFDDRLDERIFSILLKFLKESIKLCEDFTNANDSQESTQNEEETSSSQKDYNALNSEEKAFVSYMRIAGGIMIRMATQNDDLVTNTLAKIYWTNTDKRILSLYLSDVGKCLVQSSKKKKRKLTHSNQQQSQSQ